MDVKGEGVAEEWAAAGILRDRKVDKAGQPGKAVGLAFPLSGTSQFKA